MTAARDAVGPGGVGLYLDTWGAVVALTRPDPLRLTAIAHVTWPSELWQPAGAPAAAMSRARRMLARARRRLGLARWSAVAVVVGPTLGTGPGGPPPWVLPRGAELLARAGLAQGWVSTPDRAAMLAQAGTVGAGWAVQRVGE